MESKIMANPLVKKVTSCFKADPKKSGQKDDDESRRGGGGEE